MCYFCASANNLKPDQIDLAGRCSACCRQYSFKEGPGHAPGIPGTWVWLGGKDFLRSSVKSVII